MTEKEADDHLFRAWFAAFLWLVFLLIYSLMAYSAMDPHTRSPSSWWFHVPVIALLVYWSSRGAALPMVLLFIELLWQHGEGLLALYVWPTATVLIVGYFLVRGLQAVSQLSGRQSRQGGAPNQRL